MSLRWKVCKSCLPYNQCDCVVGRIIDHKTSYFIGCFYSYCDDLYWILRNGCRINVMQNDHWCDINDIIKAVEDKFEEELLEIDVDNFAKYLL